ncbi:hypothetical protein [Catelliglobosispora koreensis]|uniref:hypothetical protein n=1 Tax=Catelliglobosispora koreensis TaxID=129052 RepID=UPI000379616D|nr:hypothetical protein [Catelliglobosispora koreensis]
MDALGLLHPAAHDLLSRSDGVLIRAGAPERHEILSLLRRAGQLPADAVADLVAWDPAALDEHAALLTRSAGQYRDLADQLDRPVAWEGPAAEAFASRAATAATQCHELAGSASTLAAHLTGLAEWLRVVRRQLAQTLAAALSSAEAVSLTVHGVDPLQRVAAAARVGTTVLREITAIRAEGERLAASWPSPVVAVSRIAPAGISSRIQVDGLA